MAKRLVEDGSLSPESGLRLLPDDLGPFDIVRLLSDGPVTRSWLLKDSEEQQAVLRLDTPLARALGLNRQQEISILRSLVSTRLAPSVIHAQPEEGLLLTQYRVGRTWTKDDVSEPENRRRLGALLARVHRQIPPAGARPRFVGAARSYAELIGTGKANDLADEIEVLIRRLAAHSPPACLCHNDPHLGNLLDGRGLSLLDWEYAAAGDPLFDLAVLYRHEDLEKVHLLEIARIARGSEFTTEDKHRFRRWCAVYDRIVVLWFGVVAKRLVLSESDMEIVRAAEARIESQPLT